MRPLALVLCSLVLEQFVSCRQYLQAHFTACWQGELLKLERSKTGCFLAGKPSEAQAAWR